jgi:uncharacterized membrane protein (DUF2068 family)
MTKPPGVESKGAAVRFTGLRVIAAAKVAKGVALAAAGLGAFHLINHNLTQLALNLAYQLRIDPENFFVRKALEKIAGLDPNRLRHFGWILLAFSADLFAEGIGLWFNQTWAKYLVLVATCFFVPFEIRAGIRNIHLGHYGAFSVDLGVFAINVAIIFYLAQHVWKFRSRPEEA